MIELLSLNESQAHIFYYMYLVNGCFPSFGFFLGRLREGVRWDADMLWMCAYAEVQTCFASTRVAGGRCPHHPPRPPLPRLLPSPPPHLRPGGRPQA